MKGKEMMETSDESIKKGWADVEYKHIEKALEHLRQHEEDIRIYLADCVAAVCGVERKDMFSESDVACFAHSRYLYWYAYRYMTGEAYEKIARQVPDDGHHFVLRSVQNGVNKMSRMIEEEPVWKRRWTIIKRIIKLRWQEDEGIDKTIVIQVPKTLKGKVNISIKDK
jgi:chromosomal replication initiation ATPase DnaA